MFFILIQKYWNTLGKLGITTQVILGIKKIKLDQALYYYWVDASCFKEINTRIKVLRVLPIGWGIDFREIFLVIWFSSFY